MSSSVPSHSLENIKLTTEEEEVIKVSDEGRQEEIESCTLSLLGKFLTCKSFNKGSDKHTKESMGVRRRSSNHGSGFKSVSV